MPIQYDKESDTLYVTLGPEIGEAYEYEAGPFSVLIDDSDALTQISVREARKFIAHALAAGVEADGVPDSAPSDEKPVWEDVDSSMISAFKMKYVGARSQNDSMGCSWPVSRAASRRVGRPGAIRMSGFIPRTFEIVV